MKPRCNIIYKNNIAYEILDVIGIHHFLNGDDSINKQVLGLYVHEIEGDHVLQRDNDFLICNEIEEAIIINE
jgi:hypothetical protein|tara:strand:+ start:2082 stop:2297 length:216 start_codon:yes stop_codon:yes gene_type:complete